MSTLFGSKIKEVRKEQSILQRQLAVLLDIDTPMFSKIERGERRAKREQVVKLADFLEQDKLELLTLWLADKVIEAVNNEDAINLAAIKVARIHLQNE
ncbi:MAG: helix-turn-helix transcriptional regulator [Prevotella sp.]|nr:helix-turn-helix transcriptional regulator [Prevotella sp.]